MNGTVTSVDWSNNGDRYLSLLEVMPKYTNGMLIREYVFIDLGTMANLSLRRHQIEEWSLLCYWIEFCIVNVYDETCLALPNPKTLKSIMNLTTNVHDMKFNHDSQILGISSHSKKNQLKLVPLPSLIMFPNWPNNLKSLKLRSMV
ncbi:16922_t:CDS:2 [Gigaspora rosea]|nr:16922_t:CDS:2 [Gigaspora rosea]